MIPNCRGKDTEIFYDPFRYAEAAKTCAGCPLLIQCRWDFADDPHAFAGGMRPSIRLSWVFRERRATRTPQPKREAVSGPAATPASKKLTTEAKIEIIRIFDSELIGSKAIADRVGVSKSTVQRVLRRAGRERTEKEILELSRAGGLSGGQKGVGEQNTRMVMKLLGEGYKVREVCEMTGLHPSTVYGIRSKNR